MVAAAQTPLAVWEITVQEMTVGEAAMNSNSSSSLRDRALRVRGLEVVKQLRQAPSSDLNPLLSNSKCANNNSRDNSNVEFS